ncbi:ABC transporter permease [uncultured Propionivibrio sp.]|uniref:ABC transporter permease n=1 Tax=uncultured Propionivibrio sp. TaxID=426737 RepID=UPI0029BFCC7B|nr:ABC transporter permease [uncultured Propionivibrio sp.]
MNYLLRRLLAVIPVLAVVAVIVFLLLRLAPGDPAVIIAGDTASAEDIEHIRQTLGLNRPVVEQFVSWIGQILRGDLGNSVFTGMPVAEMIRQRVEPTLWISALTMAFAVVFAVPMGIIAAWKAGTWVDRAVSGLAVAAFSLPVFVIGYGLVYGFSTQLDWFPVQGFKSLSDGFIPFIHHLALPVVSGGLIYMALLARMTRSTMLEVLAQDYIRTARAKGLSSQRLLLRHALKNAAVPIVTTIGLGIAMLLSGVIVTESVFAIPGIGRLTVDSILRRDYPVIQGIVLVTATAYVLINLITDLLYGLFDPRIRY